MSRIDVETLVRCFEAAIDRLNKNPIEAVSDAQISSMLISSLKHEIQAHFSYIIKREIKKLLKKEFRKTKTKLVKEILKNMLTSSDFREQLEKKIKSSIIENIK